MNCIVQNSKARKGTVLVCVLACLGIVIAMVMSTVQSALRGRNVVRMQQQLLQTELLCEAGVKRAAQQLSKSSAYRGEKWVPKSSIASFEFAVIEIKLEPSPEGNKSLRAEVIASLASSANSNDRMQRSHTFAIELLSTASEQE